MTISKLREVLNNNIPPEYDEYEVIYRKFDDDGDSVIFFDHPLTSVYMDDANNEAAFLDEEGWQYFNQNLTEDDENQESDDDIIPEY